MQSTLRLLRRLQGLDGVFRIGLVAVEEMLGVIKDLRGPGFQVFERVVNELEVLLERDAQGLMDMEIPGLAEDGDCVRLGLNQGTDILVLVRRDLGATGGAEGGDLCLGKLFLLDILEKGNILGIAPRPPSLDVMDADFIQLVGNADLVLDQK